MISSSLLSVLQFFFFWLKNYIVKFGRLLLSFHFFFLKFGLQFWYFFILYCSPPFNLVEYNFLPQKNDITITFFDFPSSFLLPFPFFLLWLETIFGAKVITSNFIISFLSIYPDNLFFFFSNLKTKL